MAPAQARHLVDRAMRVAQASRSVTCVIVPEDVQESPYEEPPRAHGSVFSSVGFKKPEVVPKPADLDAAAEVLNSGKKVSMLIGAGALGAENEVTQVADLLGCGVAKALNGKAALPDDLPFVTGSIGLLGTKPSDHMMQNCDTLLMVGTSFPYSEWLPKEGQAKAVQIDIDGRNLGMRYPIDVNLVGDAKETLRELTSMLERKSDRSWREEIEHEVSRWWEIMDDRANEPAEPLNPELVFQRLSPRLPDNCIITSD